MKILWFHLMPYTELPEDFQERHPSVWVDIDSRLFDPARAHLMYNDFLDELEHAADCGFHGICVNEHHANGYGLMPSPNLIAIEMNVGQLMLLLHFGNMDKDLVQHNSALFAEGVLPQLEGLFEDQWENRWWPQPLPRERRAEPKAVRL